jgi:hypothetical protein
MKLNLENKDEPSTALPRSSVNPSNSWTCTQLHESTQQHETVLPQGLNHQYRVLPQGLYQATPSSVLPQGLNQATPSSVLPQGLSRATPSSVWSSDLIPILQRIAALPCRQPSRPLFAFEFSLEAANKNFILLMRKFGGDLSKAILAQSDSHLGYESEFKPIDTLELIFRNHPSWNRMKQILTHRSNWPLQPLNKEDRIKDVEEALVFWKSQRRSQTPGPP